MTEHEEYQGERPAGPYLGILQRIEAKLDRLLEGHKAPLLDPESMFGLARSAQAETEQPSGDGWIERKDWGAEYPTGKVDLQFRGMPPSYAVDAADMRWEWRHNHPDNITAYRPAKEQP